MVDDVVPGDEGGEVEKGPSTRLPSDPRELPLLLTADEVAALLRTSRAAIYAMADRNRLPGVTRIGRRLLVNRDALLRALVEGRAPSSRGTRR